MIAPIVIGGLLFLTFFIWEQYIVWKVLPNTDPLIPARVWGYHNLLPVTIQTGLMYGSFFLIVLNGATFLIRVQEVRILILTIGKPNPLIAWSAHLLRDVRPRCSRLSLLHHDHRPPLQPPPSPPKMDVSSQLYHNSDRYPSILAQQRPLLLLALYILRRHRHLFRRHDVLYQLFEYRVC